MKNADLHTHSNYSSDSDISPTQLVIEAKQAGLKYIALTDHDSIDGINEFLKAGKKHNIEAIPGIELHSKFGEILGYFIDHKNKDLINLCKRNKKAINERAFKTIKKLGADGYVLNPEKIKKKYNRKILERPLIAIAMVDKGYTESFRTAFDDFLAKGNKYFIETNLLSSAEVIKIIASAKGLAVLAHPYYEYYISEFKNIKKLINAGLVGIECPELTNLYPENFNKIEDYKKIIKVVKKIKTIRQKHNLILTSGSDYHGSIHPYNILGSNNCDESIVIALKNI